jgi:hypothetical protein
LLRYSAAARLESHCFYQTGGRLATA